MSLMRPGRRAIWATHALRRRRKCGWRRLVAKPPFFQSDRPGSKIHQRHRREGEAAESWAKWDGKKKANFSPKLFHVSPPFLPFPVKFTHFFDTFPKVLVWQFLTIPHFPPQSDASLWLPHAPDPSPPQIQNTTLSPPPPSTTMGQPDNGTPSEKRVTPRPGPLPPPLSPASQARRGNQDHRGPAAEAMVLGTKAQPMPIPMHPPPKGPAWETTEFTVGKI